MKARSGRYCAVRWKDGKVFADAAAEVGAAYAAQDYRDRTGETTAVVKDGKLVRIYTVPAKKNIGRTRRRGVAKRVKRTKRSRAKYAVCPVCQESVRVPDVPVRATGMLRCSRGHSFVYGSRARRNPLLGIFGGNPKVKVVRELGRVVEVRYKRKDDGGLYYHKYASKPRLLALSDGSIWIKGA